MKRMFGIAFTIAVAALTPHALAAQQSSSQQRSSQQSNAQPQSQSQSGSNTPSPVTVEVVSVDPASRTITVRDITAVPAGSAGQMTLPMSAQASGRSLNEVKAGERVNLTCTVKKTASASASGRVVLNDCESVSRIDEANSSSTGSSSHK